MGYASKKGITCLIILSALVTTNSAMEPFSYLAVCSHLKKSTKVFNKSTSFKSRVIEKRNEIYEIPKIDLLVAKKN